MHWLIPLIAVPAVPIVILCLMRQKFRSLKSYNLDGIKSLLDLSEFSLERIRVETEDGYILSLFNIRHKDNYDPSKKPVIFQHGIGSSAAGWLIGGTENSPACILAKKGHDVYLASSRGTVYSLEHQNLNPKQKAFWEFSFQQMKHDIKANIELVSERCGGKVVHYIGHSQGAVSMLAALADPDRQTAQAISNKLHIFYCLSPVIYTKRNGMTRMWLGSHLMAPGRRLLEAFGVYGIQPAAEKISLRRRRIIDWPKNLNKKMVFRWIDKSNEFINTDLFGTFMGFHPHGHSLHSLSHFIQIYSGPGVKYFKKYDYGREENLRRYGNIDPPSYNFGLIKEKLRLYYGDQDGYISLEDMEMLIEDLSGNPGFKSKLIKGYGHIAFTLGLENHKFYSELLEDEVEGDQSIEGRQD